MLNSIDRRKGNFKGLLFVLGLLIIGWALGLLSAIIASLFYRFTTVRREQTQAREGYPPSASARKWSLYRLCLQVGAPVALLSLVVLFLLRRLR